MKRSLGLLVPLSVAVMLMGSFHEELSRDLGNVEQAVSTMSAGSVTTTFDPTSPRSRDFCVNVNINTRNAGSAVSNGTLRTASNGATISSICSHRSRQHEGAEPKARSRKQG